MSAGPDPGMEEARLAFLRQIELTLDRFVTHSLAMAKELGNFQETLLEWARIFPPDGATPEGYEALVTYVAGLDQIRDEFRAAVRKHLLEAFTDPSGPTAPQWLRDLLDGFDPDKEA